MSEKDRVNLQRLKAAKAKEREADARFRKAVAEIRKHGGDPSDLERRAYENKYGKPKKKKKKKPGKKLPDLMQHKYQPGKNHRGP